MNTIKRNIPNWKVNSSGLTQNYGSNWKNNIPLINQLQKRLIDNKEDDLIIGEKDESIIFRGCLLYTSDAADE